MKRIKNLFWALGALSLLSSCSSSLTYPPQRQVIMDYQMKLENNPDFAKDIDLNRLEENERQAFLFQQAKHFEANGNNNAACDRYKYLSSDKSFPMAQLALINSLKVCNYLSIKNILIWNGSLKDVEPSFRKVFLENSIELAKKKEQWEYFVQFGVEYTNYIDTKEKREKHLTDLKKALPKRNGLIPIINDKLYEIAPRFIPSPKKEDYYKVAKDFSRVRKFKRARTYFLKFYTDKSNNLLDRIKAYYDYAFTYKLQRDKKTYAYKISALIQWLEKQEHWQVHPDVLKKYWDLRLTLARAYWTVGIDKRAKKELLDISSNPTAPSDTKANGFLILGLMELEKKNSDQAETYFTSGLEQPELEEETLENLSWNLSWNYFINTKLQKARDVLKTTIEKSKDESFSRKLRFWLAKTQQKLGHLEEANDIWEDIIEEGSFDYYGIVSAMETKTVLPPIDPEIAEEDSYTPKQTDHPILDWLVAYDMWELAEEFMKDLQNQVKESSDIEDILPLYHFAKYYDGGIFKFYRISEEDRNDALEEHILAAFPTAYKKEFMDAQLKFKIPASFLMAVARQESSFNNTARSWADAFGVLQVTPEKAKSYSRRYKIPYKSYEDLYDPGTNILLGTALYKDLLTKGRGTFISSVAAYNAGKKPVNNWYKTRMREDPLEFIEMIPYRETRKYIKLVFRNYITYGRLLGKAAKLDKDFLSGRLLDQ